jgi:hypothetical protein
MALKLIALDVDGTLLTDDRKVQEETVNAVYQAKEKGAKVVITTGRPLVSTKPLLEKFDLDGKDSQYVIVLHGAVVETTKGGILTDTPIPIEQVIKVAALIQNYPDIDLMVQTQDQIYVLKHDLNWYTSFESFKNHLPIHFRTLSELKNSSHSFYKMMFSAPEEKLDELTPNLPDWIYSELETIRSERYYIDMVNLKVDKGEALSNLASQLKIDPSEVMAIGDGNSDISMVKYAGVGVAMKNATPDLLKVANYVTDDNNHAGVAKAIKTYIDN